MAGKFEIYRDRRGDYGFRLKTPRGRVLATGSSFPTKDGAKRGVASVLLAVAGAQVNDETETSGRRAAEG